MTDTMTTRCLTASPHDDAPEQARTERDILDGLDGTFTLHEIYAAVEASGVDVTSRDDGQAVIHGASDTRWRRRTRGQLVSRTRNGRARRIGDGVWMLTGTPQTPRTAVLLSLSGKHSDIELRVSTAAQLLTELDEPCSLLIADPPYSVGVGKGVREDTGQRTYRRNHAMVMQGYREVPEGMSYGDFCESWIPLITEYGVLREGGTLAVITGPQQAAWVQTTAERAGLTYVNSIAVGKIFPLRTTRRFAHAHWTATVMCQGRLESRKRIFNCPPDLPKARNGTDYPQDIWAVGSVGKAEARPEEVRYPNTLPFRFVDRLMHTYTRPAEETPVADLVVDPFLGGGTSALAALTRGLRFQGCDASYGSVRFTMGRLSRHLLERRTKGHQLSRATRHTTAVDLTP